MSEECDCYIGELCSEKTYLSTLRYEVNRVVESQTTFRKYRMLLKEPASAYKIIDGRQGYLSRFQYCPYCGTKINWKEILKEFKQ